MEKVLKIKGNCPRGGVKLAIDENGSMHACRLQRYIYTAQFLDCDVLEFDNTKIKLRKSKQDENN